MPLECESEAAGARCCSGARCTRTRLQKAHRCRPAEGSAEKALSKEATTVRKCHDGASLQRNRSELSENAARGPLFRLPTTSNPALQPQNRRSQLSPAPNSPIPPEQHACNKAPLRRFLTKEAREGAVPGTHPPGLSHFPEKSAALFHVEGKTRERRRVRNASPAGKEPAMVEQTFECSNCHEVFNKEHTAEVMWTQCPYCGGRSYPY